MRLPRFSDTEVFALVAYSYPVVRIGGELLNDVGLRWPGGDLHERFDWQRLHLPPDAGQVNGAVVMEERTFVAVVIQPLLDDVGRPAQVNDGALSAELGQSEPVFAAVLSEVGEVGETHTTIVPVVRVGVLDLPQLQRTPARCL